MLTIGPPQISLLAVHAALSKFSGLDPGDIKR